MPSRELGAFDRLAVGRRNVKGQPLPNQTSAATKAPALIWRAKLLPLSAGIAEIKTIPSIGMDLRHYPRERE